MIVYCNDVLVIAVLVEDFLLQVAEVVVGFTRVQGVFSWQ